MAIDDGLQTMRDAAEAIVARLLDGLDQDGDALADELAEGSSEGSAVVRRPHGSRHRAPGAARQGGARLIEPQSAIAHGDPLAEQNVSPTM